MSDEDLLSLSDAQLNKVRGSPPPQILSPAHSASFLRLPRPGGPASRRHHVGSGSANASRTVSHARRSRTRASAFAVGQDGDDSRRRALGWWDWDRAGGAPSRRLGLQAVEGGRGGRSACEEGAWGEQGGAWGEQGAASYSTDFFWDSYCTVPGIPPRARHARRASHFYIILNKGLHERRALDHASASAAVMPSDLRNRATASAADSAVAKLPRCFWRPSCFTCAWNFSCPRTRVHVRHTPLKPVMFSARRSVRCRVLRRRVRLGEKKLC